MPENDNEVILEGDKDDYYINESILNKELLKITEYLKELDKIVSLGGGVPLVVDGKTVGSIGVAGAPSAEMDEQIANKGASVLK